MLNDFLALGFEPIVNLKVSGDRFAPDDLSWKDSSGWLYAIVSDDTVRYVGLTANVLRSRMDQYRHGVGEQGKRIRALVVSELQLGRLVQIYGLKSPHPHEREREEARLRREYSLPWNLC